MLGTVWNWSEHCLNNFGIGIFGVDFLGTELGNIDRSWLEIVILSLLSCKFNLLDKSILEIIFGILVGMFAGILVGMFAGILVGMFAGILVGMFAGILVGMFAGILVGMFAGILL